MTMVRSSERPSMRTPAAITLSMKWLRSCICVEGLACSYISVEDELLQVGDDGGDVDVRGRRDDAMILGRVGVWYEIVLNDMVDTRVPG